MPTLTAALGRGTPARPGVAAFDLGGKGSLAAWFSSLMLLAASLVAVLVYTVRRHRMDDYRGRYRVWLWAALCWFLMATDAAASLHEGFRDLMTAAHRHSAAGRRLDLVGDRLWLVARGGRDAAADRHVAVPAVHAPRCCWPRRLCGGRAACGWDGCAWHGRPAG